MLSRDSSCVRDMLWRIRLPEPVDLNALAARLIRAGWRDRSRMPNLKDLEGPDGHRLVLLPRTSRVQLRLHYLTPYESRVAEAERLHRFVCSEAR